MVVDIETPSKYIFAHLFWPEIKVLSKFERAFFAQAFNQQIGEGTNTTTIITHITQTFV